MKVNFITALFALRAGKTIRCEEWGDDCWSMKLVDGRPFIFFNGRQWSSYQVNECRKPTFKKMWYVN